MRVGDVSGAIVGIHYSVDSSASLESVFINIYMVYPHVVTTNSITTVFFVCYTFDYACLSRILLKLTRTSPSPHTHTVMSLNVTCTQQVSLPFSPICSSFTWCNHLSTLLLMTSEVSSVEGEIYMYKLLFGHPMWVLGGPNYIMWWRY